MVKHKAKVLTTHLDDRGYVVEVLRNDDKEFTRFGQVYVSVSNPGVVKGFHKHSKQTEHVTCVSGQVKLVLITEVTKDNKQAEVEEYYLSPISPILVVIPPNTWYGWATTGSDKAILVNVTDTPFDNSNPDSVRMDPHNNPWGYTWKTEDR